MAKRNFTEEEKKILKAGIGTILWKILFWPAALWELIVVITTLPDFGEYAVVFWIFTIPFLAIFYMAFRKQWFWKEEKQREFIAKVQARRNGKPSSGYTAPAYTATPYATKPSEQSIRTGELHGLSMIHMQNQENNSSQ